MRLYSEVYCLLIITACSHEITRLEQLIRDQASLPHIARLTKAETLGPRGKIKVFFVDGLQLEVVTFVPRLDRPTEMENMFWILF